MENEIGRISNKSETISTMDFLYVFIRRRRLIFFSTLIIALATFFYGMLSLRMSSDSPWNLLPNIYRPEAKVLLQDDNEPLNALAAYNPALSLVVGSGGNSSAALAQELLTGRTLIDQIVEEFNLIDYYGIKENPRTNSRNEFLEALSFELNEESAVLSVFYEDKDPVFATIILTRVIEYLELRFRALTMETVLLKKQFLEDRLQAVRVDLDQAQDQLIEFQREYGIVDLTSQSNESVIMIAEYKREILSKQVKLQGLLEYLPEGDAAIVRLKNEVKILKQLIEEMQTGFQEFSGLTIARDELPRISIEYLSLKRDVKLQEGIYALLREQYEKARIEETDTSKPFQIIEVVDTPEVKYWPRRSIIVALVTLITFILSILVAFILEYFERVKSDPIEGPKLVAIKESLKNKRK